MAELVDALASGASAARRGGSSPLLGTKNQVKSRYYVDLVSGGVPDSDRDISLRVSSSPCRTFIYAARAGSHQRCPSSRQRSLRAVARGVSRQSAAGRRPWAGIHSDVESCA